MSWTERQVEELVSAVKSGLSAGQCAVRINKSRNACISKARRIGMHFDSESQKRDQIRAANGKFKRALARPQFSGTHVEPQGVSLAPVSACRADILPDLGLPAYEPPAPERGLSILHVSNKTCRFPLDDGPDYHFCGAAAKGGSPYCAAHHKVAYISEQKRRRETAKQKAHKLRMAQRGKANAYLRVVEAAE